MAGAPFVVAIASVFATPLETYAMAEAEGAGVSVGTVSEVQNRNSSEKSHDEPLSDTKAKPSDEPTNPADDIDIETQSGREGRKKRGDG